MSGCPELAPLLAGQGSGVTRLRLPPAQGGGNKVKRGVWQGSALSNPAFCMALMEALMQVVSLFNESQPGAAHLQCYADEFIFIVKKEYVRRQSVEPVR